MSLYGHSAVRSLTGLRLRRPARPDTKGFAAILSESDQDPSSSELLVLAASDPLIAAWILKQANESYYGMRSTVDSLHKAFDLLGASAIVQMIAHAAGPEDEPLDSVNEDGIYTEKALTRHALGTALFAAGFANEDPLDAGPSFTAGLMHDIGKHIIVHNFPAESARVYSESSLWDQIKGADLLSVEQLAFGVNHSEAGEYLARKMHFPDSLTAVMGSSAAPDVLTHPPGQRPLPWLAYAANLCSSATGYAAGKRVSVNQCLHDPVWQTIHENHLISDVLLNDLRTDFQTTASRFLSALPTFIFDSRLKTNPDHPPVHNRRSDEHSSPRSRNQSHTFNRPKIDGTSSV